MVNFVVPVALIDHKVAQTGLPSLYFKAKHKKIKVPSPHGYQCQ